MDGVHEWQVRNRPLLTVVAVGIGVGLCCFGLALSFHWSIVSALPLSGPKVGLADLWRGVFTTAAGSMLIAVALLFPPTVRMKGEWS